MAAKTKKKTSAPKQSKVKQPGEARVTKVGRANELIIKGASNADVTQMLRDEFKMTLEKAQRYASWYRSNLVQKGEITKDFAVKHRGDAPSGRRPKSPAPAADAASAA